MRRTGRDGLAERIFPLLQGLREGGRKGGREGPRQKHAFLLCWNVSSFHFSLPSSLPPYLKRETADQVKTEVETAPLLGLSQETEGGVDIVKAGGTEGLVE